MTTEPVSTLTYAVPRVQGQSPQARWWTGLVRRLVWCVLGMIGVSLLIGVAAMGMRLAMFWVGPVVVLLVLITSYAAQRIRRRRSAVIVSYLDQAVRANYPLSQWLFAAAQSERGAIRRRLLRLVDGLRLGVDVADALELSVPEATRRQIAVVRAAERAGRLRQGLSRLVRDERRNPADDVATRGMAMAYPLVVTLMLLGVMGLVMIFVIPKFELILLDFNLTMPWVSRLMLDVARILAMPLGLVAVVMFILVIGKAFEGMFFVIPDTSPPWRRVTDWLAWVTPIWRTQLRSQQLADLCDATAAGLDNGLPFDRALSSASCAATNGVLRRRVERWRAHLESGQEIHQAARGAAMPALMVGMLATAKQAAHTADVMRFLARYYESRFSRTRAVLHGAIIPIMVLVAGAFVLLVMLGLYTPMIEMADMLSIEFVP